MTIRYFKDYVDDNAASIATRAESIGQVAESMADLVDSQAIKSLPSTGQHKVHTIQKLNDGDFYIGWESESEA